MRNRQLQELLHNRWHMHIVDEPNEPRDYRYMAYYDEWPGLHGFGATHSQCIDELHGDLVYALVLAGIEAIERHTLA